MMALLGGLVLFGLTVNPAILLVDRMQQLVLGGGWSSGAAALASVRERTRPVLMTTATTVAALWPLALATGRENEIWPGFATIVIGGLVTSALLTLLIIPVGFILLRRLDDIFGRVGPWLVLAWLGTTVVSIVALIATGTVTSLYWQVVLSLLIGGGLLAVVVLIFRPRDLPQPESSQGPPRLEVRCLRKVYGLPGPLRATLRASKDFAQRVLDRGGRAFDPAEARGRLMPLALGAAGAGYLALQLQSTFWRLVLWMVAAVVFSRLVLEVRRARGKADATGAVQPGGIEGLDRRARSVGHGRRLYMGDRPCTSVGERGARSGLHLPDSSSLSFWPQARRPGAAPGGKPAANSLHGSPAGGCALRGACGGGWQRGLAASTCPRAPCSPWPASPSRSSEAWWASWGPTGPGKTTLLRQLAGVLDPTRGTIGLGGVPLRVIQRYLTRWVGYLPQDAGLPGGMTAREYLSYFAALYDLPREVRRQRVDSLLEEVGLAEKTNEPIKALSGGMRQRVAVARTLLRLPAGHHRR